jgi:hypothetical protein
MRFQIVIAGVVVLLGCAASSSAQAVSLQFRQRPRHAERAERPGQNDPREWSRLGGTRS